MTITGKIKMIGETKEFGGNGFKKKELVVTTEEQYPQHILIEFVQDKTSLLDPLKVDDKVEVSINLRGREWVNPKGEANYFNSIQGWRLEKKDAIMSPKVEAAVQMIDNTMPPEQDDLPF